MAFFIPYFALLLTAAFVSFATCIILYFPDYCIVSECSAEGVDNTATFWSIDFFVGVIVAILALHLKCTTDGGRMAAGAFLSVAIGYVSKGFSALYFGNSGWDDGKGMLGFYILTSLTNVCWTVSATVFSVYFLQAWRFLDRDEKPCGSWQGLLFLVLIGLSTLAVLVGTVALVVDSPDSFVQDTVDPYESEGNHPTVWIRVVSIAQTIFCGCYSFFFICGACIFGTLTTKDDVSIWGLPSSIASGGIVLSQVVAIGIILFYGLQLLDAEDLWQFREESHMIVHVIFGYVMMMTYFFLHNLVFALLPAKVSTKALADTDDDSDSQGKHASDVEERHPDRKDRSGSYIGNASSFRSNSFCSTSFDSRTRFTDFHTVDSRPLGNIFAEFFRLSRKKERREDVSRVSSRISDDEDASCETTSQNDEDASCETTSQNDEKSIQSEETRQDEYSADGMISQLQTIPTIKNPARSTFVQEEVVQPPTADLESPIESTESLNVSIVEEETSDEDTVTVAVDKKRVVRHLQDEGSSSGKMSRPDDATYVTKAEASIWNGCRQNVEFPIEDFNERGVEGDQKIQGRSVRIGSKGSLFQSLRRLSLFKTEEGEAKTSIDQSTVLCEASIWNGHKESLEVPLGGDRDVLPPPPPEIEPAIAEKYTGLPFLGNKSASQTDSDETKQDVQNEPGFEIIIDAFVAE
jgi:hypothetical protein